MVHPLMHSAHSSSYAKMIVGSPVSAYAKNAIRLNYHIQTQMGSNICSVLSQKSSCCFFTDHSKSSVGLSVSKTLSYPSSSNQTYQRSCFRYCFFNQRDSKRLTVKDLMDTGRSRRRQLEISLASNGVNMKLVVPKHGMLPKVKCTMGPISWPERCASAGLPFGLLVCCSSSEPVHAEASCEKEDKEKNSDSAKFSHGKEVRTDYSVIGIPGDGRCLFRSVAHGACIRSGKPAPNESLQRELADALRARVADEFIKRRKETEWFVEGDFDAYVYQMRKPHVWGGEPELFMASHVLQMPITVYMYDKEAGGLISIAEYGQEYGKENPIKVLYHGFGHYDALHIHGNKGGRSRL